MTYQGWENAGVPCFAEGEDEGRKGIFQSTTDVLINFPEYFFLNSSGGLLLASPIISKLLITASTKERLEDGYGKGKQPKSFLSLKTRKRGDTQMDKALVSGA